MESEKHGESFLTDNEVMILLVDDNKVNQFLGKKILKNLGILNVEVASDGFKALELIKTNKFNVLLTDVEMPGMNGYELTCKVREIDKGNITIIALTANATEAEREFALKNGMNDYISKPYAPADLLRVLRKHVLKRTSFAMGDASSEIIETGNPILSLYALFNGNKEDVKNLLILLRNQLPENLRTLRQSILDEQWQNTYNAAHKLKSTIKLFNDEALFSLITAITEGARCESEWNAIPAHFDEFSSGIESIMLLINNELESI